MGKGRSQPSCLRCPPGCIRFALDACRVLAVVPRGVGAPPRVQIVRGCHPRLQGAARMTATSIKIHDDVTSVEPVGGNLGAEVPQLHRWWWRACGIALALLIGVRWVRYLPVPWPPTVDHLLGGLMIYDTQLTLWPYVLTSLLTLLVHGLLVKVVLVVGGVMFLLSPRRFVRRTAGIWEFTPLLVSLLLGAMLWFHYVFDLSPFVATMCAVSLPLVWPRQRGTRAALGPRVRAAAWLVVLALSFWLARDFADRAAVGLWALVLLGIDRLAPPVLGLRARRMLLLLSIVPANLVPAFLPLVLPWHGGTRLGDGLAYDFCEVPKGGPLLASVPECDSVLNSFADCGRGRIVAYDPLTLERVAVYGFFSPDYYGRLEQLVCLEDEIHVGVQSTRYRQRLLYQTALSFPLASPDKFRPLVAGAGVGTTIVYDPGHDALFYTGEYTHRIVRYDRRTGRYDERVGEPFRRRWFHPFARWPETGSFMMPRSAVDPRRDRIYPVESMQGRYAYAVDTSTLRPVTRFAVEAGGGAGATVDSERGRLLVVSTWGLEVFDVDSGALITRKRLSLKNRPVVVDTVRNRLYVGAIVEGKIRVLDRDTFEVIDQIPIGFGTRYPYLSADGTRLFATSARAQYYWNAATLVPPR